MRKTNWTIFYFLFHSTYNNVLNLNPRKEKLKFYKLELNYMYPFSHQIILYGKKRSRIRLGMLENGLKLKNLASRKLFLACKRHILEPNYSWQENQRFSSRIAHFMINPMMMSTALINNACCSLLISRKLAAMVRSQSVA